MSKRSITRRRFVKGMGAAAVAMVIPSRALSGPNGKLNIACIGCGGKGNSDVGGVRGEYIVAMCDVDEKRAGGSYKKNPDAKKFKDYRRMFDEMGDKIDAVTVSTPDHNHFPASMLAIKRGKHVFCQKPLTHNIWEARAITEAARKYKVATQMGIQGHSNEGPRVLCEWVQAGVLGNVTEVHYWTNRPIWPQGIGRPSGSQSVPSNFAWDEWLGPAPDRPYNPAYAPFKWRGFWDFGCGALGDIGCHAMDAAFWALGLRSPTRIDAESPRVNDETAPVRSTVTYHFPARGKMGPVKVVWYDGVKRVGEGHTPPRPADLEEGRKLPGSIGGQLIFGDKATVMSNVYCSSLRIIPEAKMKDMRGALPSKSLPRSKGHVREWLMACKGEGPPAGANFDYAGPLTEMVLLGNLAVRTGKSIEWDPEKLRVTNVPEANQYVSRQPRAGWKEAYDWKVKTKDDAPARSKRDSRTERNSADVSASKGEADAERLYRSARQAERFGQRPAARGIYKKIVSEYGGTGAARKATDRLKAIGN